MSDSNYIVNLLTFLRSRATGCAQLTTSMSPTTALVAASRMAHVLHVAILTEADASARISTAAIRASCVGNSFAALQLDALSDLS